MVSFNLLLLAGDGIGIEVMAELEKMLSALSETGLCKFELEYGLIGGAAYDVYGTPITSAIVDRAQSADIVFLGAVGGPRWDDIAYDARPGSAMLRLRKELGLFANLRPAICYSALAGSSSLKREVVEGLDVLIVRELTGGIYFGEPKEIVTLEDGQRRGVDSHSMSFIENSAFCASNACPERSRRVPRGEAGRKAGCRKSARPV
jgi:3-isopropylmalate dehydrogenase